MLIAFGHRSRVGKDTAAGFLKEFWRHGPVSLLSFAEPIKQILYQMYGLRGVQLPQHYEQHPEDKTNVIDGLGMTYVELCVKFGTDLVREQLCEDTWVDLAIHQCRRVMEREPHSLVVFTDLRFPNELAAVQAANGWCVKIDRPAAPAYQSGADNALLGGREWDAVILNNGSLQQLCQKVLDLTHTLAKKEGVLC